MRKLISALLTFAMIFSLCACGSGSDESQERDCGVFVTVQAGDIYTVSCGTDKGSESFSNADGGVIESGTVIHFDFAGDAAEASEDATIGYSICAYDKNLDIIADSSFSDDFSDMAKYSIVITEDHHILYEGQEYSCGGDIIVDYEDLSPVSGVSLMAANVSMPNRPEASDTINAAIKSYNDTFAGEQYEANKAAYGQNGETEAQTTALEPFSMSRTVRVMRGDSAVLSFRMADRVNLGDGTTLTINCHSFDPQTGKELSISDIAENKEKFTDFCAERVLVSTTEEERFLTDTMIFVEGYTDNIRALISDGHWYFSSEGLVFAANPGDISYGFYEFVIPYEDLKDVLKDEYFSADTKGDYGNVSLQLTANADLSKLDILGNAPDESISSMIMTAAGNVYDISVYTGVYSSESGSFTPDRQLVFCSDLMRGGAIAIDRAPANGSPDLMVSFTCPDGTVRKLLVSADEANGGLLIQDLDGGNEGIIVNGSTSCDLNGDGSDEILKVQKGSTVSLAVGNASAEAEVSDASVRLYDLNGDGVTEIYVSGSSLSGDAVTYCFVYDGTLTLLGEPLSGAVNEFNGNRLYLTVEMDVLGKHPVNISFFYDTSAAKLSAVQGSEYSFSGDAVITTAVPMALKDGTNIPANTELHLKSTDGESYVKISASNGASGVLGISKDTMGAWTINGQPASVCFKDLA